MRCAAIIGRYWLDRCDRDPLGLNVRFGVGWILQRFENVMSVVKQKAQIIRWRAKSALLDAAFRVFPRRVPLSECIFVSGSPRSGTTWLGEVFGHRPGYFQIHEPFNLRIPGLVERGFTWRTAIHPDDEWLVGQGFLPELFQGDFFTPAMLVDNTVRQVIGRRSAVVKAVRANRFISWIVRNLELRGVVYLIRHPCAVVSSQMIHPNFPGVTKPGDMDLAFIDRYMPSLSGFVRGLRYEEEFWALTWALDQYWPLGFRDENKITVPYEKLILEEGHTFTDLHARLGLDLDRQEMERLRGNSREAHGWSVDHSAASVDERLASWQPRLTAEQVARILDVVQRIGITGYDKDPLPDFDRIGVGSWTH